MSGLRSVMFTTFNKFTAHESTDEISYERSVWAQTLLLSDFIGFSESVVCMSERMSVLPSLITSLHFSDHLESSLSLCLALFTSIDDYFLHK